jgi:hypothetical protein
MQPPPRALNAPPEKYGARISQGLCARTLGYTLGHRLWPVGSWLALGAFPLVSQSICKVKWAFVFVLLKYVTWEAYFDAFPCLCLQNIYIPKLVEMLVIMPCF